MPATMVVSFALCAHIELRPRLSPHKCRNSLRLHAYAGERYCELTDVGTKSFDEHMRQGETDTNDLVTNLFELDVKETGKRLGEIP